MASLSHHEYPHVSSCEIEANNNIKQGIKIHTSVVDMESGLREGASLTWKDLWVKAINPQGSSGNKSILHGISGYAKPGEVLAIMGPSGCGKSTLLDALTGRLGANTRQAGDILINGCNQALAYGTSAYVTQEETLITSLTVGETVYYSAQLQLPSSMTSYEKKERAEMTIKEMGLQDSVNTRIGGSWGAKGLSGGQKRRLSIAIDILTRPYLLLLDEPTSGLDSAASYYVMSRIKNLDQREKRTIIVTIHQPSSEVFGLFHNLCLLSSGKVIYYGPASAANEFFASNGFPCPILHNPSDHFLKTINKDFYEDTGEGSISKNPTEVIDILVASYRSSSYYKHVENQISDICEQEWATLEKSYKQASFINQCFILTKRCFVNMNRDIGYYWMRLAIYIGLALGMGTIYYNIGTNYSSIQARGALLTFVSTFLSMMAVGGFPSFVEDMKVFRRERLNGYYPSGAFVIANTLSSIPYLSLISVIPGAISYYMMGLQRSFDHFLYFCSVLLACMLLVESLMMVVASIVPNFLVGIVLGVGIQGLMALCGGFFRLPNDLPEPFWKYPMYYISFHRYTFEGLYKNEFEGLTFPFPENGPGIVDGETVLRDIWEIDLGFSKWGDLAVLLGMMVFYRLLFWGIIMIREYGKSYCCTTMFTRAKQETQIAENPTATPVRFE